LVKLSRQLVAVWRQIGVICWAFVPDFYFNYLIFNDFLVLA